MKSRVLVLALTLSTLGMAASGQEQARNLASSDVHPGVAPAATADPSATGDSYTIAASDVLAVTVWKEPTLSGSMLVRPDGKISMPLLGDIQASGLKPMQLAAQITGDLRKFIKTPEVSVVVSQTHTNFVYMLGEVNKKEPVTLRPGMTLLEAVAFAGGLTDFANKKKIYILRTLDGKQQKIHVNYKKALDGDAAFNLALSPGDTIVVP